jgi:amino acid transporter
MLEANAFLAMFVVQIVVLTIVYPARLIKRLGEINTRYPQEQFPQLYPPGSAAAERRMGITYVVLNTVVAVAGLVLLGWAFTYMRRPDWHDDPVKALVTAYFVLQIIPFAVFFLTAFKHFKKWRNSFQIERRTATLERRGLFDFVSPFLVFLALLCYPLLIGLALYTEQDRFDALMVIGGITFIYAMFALGVYASLYGKRNPFQTHEDRMRAMEISVKGSVYTGLGTVVFLALTLTLAELDFDRWLPFAISVFFVFSAVVCLRNILSSVPRELKLDGLRPTLPEGRGATSAG